MKKNKIQFRYIIKCQDQPLKNCLSPRDRKMLSKLYHRLRREERVVLKSESKIKDEKIFLIGNVIERRNLCYYRELIWRKGNNV